jgi:hypothetical protein
MQSNYYVDPVKFHNLLVTYKKNGESDRKTWNEIGKCFLLIAKRQLMRMKFYKYSEDRQNEMESLACLYMIRYYKNFDPSRGSSAFSYFTQVATNATLQILNSYKIKDEMFCSLDLLTSNDSVHTSESYNIEEE